MRTRDFTPIPVEKQEGGDEILDDFFPLRVPTFTTVSMEHNFSFFEIASMRRRKTLIGFNDDIVDVKLIPNTRIAAVATNSPQIRLFNLDTMAAELVTGHPESVMTIEVSPCGRFLASTSRDATVRIWLFEAEPEGESQGVGLTARCIGICQGHAESISALAFSVKSADLELKSKSNAFTNSNAARSGASHVSNYNACGFFSITGARDRTMKVWNLSPLLAYVDPAHAAAFSAGEAVWVRHNDEDIDVSAARSAGELVMFVSQSTVLAHEKDINSVAIAPNNKMIASCSQDKTVKLWQLQSGILSPITTMRGHKRGVWCVAFAPVDKVLMTSSSDKTIRLWSVTDFTCIRTFQGHQAPVLRAVFLRAGMQLMSADGDGVMKLWTVADGECVTTLDEPHDQRVWGLAADPKDRMLVSGGADSRLVVWEDTTAYDIALQDAESQARAVQEQHLVNALRKREWEKSFDIALSLAHPRRVYSVLSELVDAETRYKRWRHLRNKRHAARAARRRARVTAGGEDEDSDQEEEFLFIEAKENLELKVPKPSTTVARMMTHRTVDELEKLVAYIQEWNTNSKFSHVAQYTLSALVSTVAPEVLRDVPRIKDAIAALNVYSQRHFTRVNTLLQSSYLIDYVFSTVNMLAPAVELEGEDVGDGNKYMMNVLQLDVEDSGLEDEIVSDSEDELADDGADDEDEDADEDAADEDVSDDEAEEAPRKKQPVDDDEEEIDAIMAKLDRKLPTDGSKLLGDVEESQEAYEVDDSDSAFWQSAGNWESSSVPESSPVSAPEAVPKKRKSVAQADEKPATSSRRKKTRS
jgi:U3 small nucleolar RNA-associated protein 13